jgi:hypothetical protein
VLNNWLHVMQAHDMTNEQMREVMQKRFGRSTSHACFEIARTGTEGGIREILRTAAELYFMDKAEHRVGGLVADYLAGRSLDDKRSDTEEYMRKYERLIPAELREGGATRILMNLQQVLQQHPFSLRDLRRRTG